MLKIRPEEDSSGVRIKVVGVGGAGGNAVSRMVERLSGVDLVAINTDSQELSADAAPVKLQIGRRLTEGLGTGANPELGKFAANEDRAQISELLKGANVIFLTLGLGSGTGTGAGPVVAKIARDNGAVVIGFVTLPFAFDGPQKMEIAQQGLLELRKHVDTLIAVSNEKIFEVVTPGTTIEIAFGMVDEILYQGVAAISDLITQPGLMNLDFADLRTIVTDGGDGLMGTGSAEGPNRAEEAARLSMSNPFLKSDQLVRARNVLISIAGGQDLGIYDVRKAATIIYDVLNPEAKRFCGTVIDSNLSGLIKVTVIATGLKLVEAAKKEKEAEKEHLGRRQKLPPEEGPTLFGSQEGKDLPAFLRDRMKKEGLA